jgi:putative Holliday junction resolvase
MKCIGVDYGAKRVGVALSDENGSIAFPKVVLRNDEKLIAALVTLVREERAELFVVGDTLSHGGFENPITRDAEHFAEQLQKESGLPVERVPEVWSSVEASRFAPKGEHNDAAAAAIILQRYLDMKHGAVE